MIDTGLIVEALRSRGHEVGHVIPTPANAGEYEFEVDGATLTLTETRALLENDDAVATEDCSCKPVLLVVEEEIVQS